MQPTREFTLPTLSTVASVVTDAGCVRDTNEDNGRHITPFVNAASNRRGSLTIVADGMGGHSSGEVASEMAVELISQYFYDDETTPVMDALRSSIERASAEIYESSVKDKRYFGMGTTIVALAIQDNIGYAAHVGDSRLYRLRSGQMERLTMDHSQVMEMVKLGIISFSEAQHHEDKNIILRAVGTQPAVEVEMSEPFIVDPGDEFMLCSDGLCDMADDEEIREMWLNADNVHTAAERLVELAKERGGNDNITVGVVRVSLEETVPVVRMVPVTREVEGLK